MDLFQRVNVRLTGHASGLEKRAVALARKHEATASKCQNLVQDVKQSVI